MEPSPPSEPSFLRAPERVSGAVRFWLIALFVVSLGLRLWYASPGLDSGRSYDERFGFRNLTGLLRDGTLRPRHAYYPSLAHLPQAALLATSEGLHRATGVAAFGIHADTVDGWSPTAYLLVRILAALFGALSLLTTYAIGRRLFSPGVGLLAAAILAAFPRHLMSSAQFKPDTLVVLLTTVTFLWTLDAVEKPTLRRFLRVGLGVGLTVSAKYTGVAAAVPIVIAVFYETWRQGRRALPLWGRLVAAGAASMAVFVALNPYLGEVLKFG
ncbi:MAG TPA: glycosyltransferase family 39 protein, partial [Thermoanaerobaculia bacterium]|nr:glycosyltransferase family 39 protein [Thermoanaerobaculia bacterium]